jgi:predicted DNA-binding transcriptional regulator YafY
MGDPQYHQVSIPDDKPRPEYSYVERRAAILRIIEKRGHPWGLNKSQLGREFGVSDAQIHKDLDRLKDYYSNRIGKEAKTTSELAYKRIIKDHLENDELTEARKALDSWNSWLQDTGHQEKEPDKVDVGGEGIVFNFQEPTE